MKKTYSHSLFKFGVSHLMFILNIFLLGSVYAAPLTKIENCTLVKTIWADGDSFQIQIPHKPVVGKEPGHEAEKRTIRLYGVDCIEAKIVDDNDARRLRAQRRHFGVTQAGQNPAAAIALAKSFGNQATKETQQLLGKPFTVYTSYADGRGDPKFNRIYAFVITSDGKDLADVLVSKGLARAVGVARETYDNRHRDEYKAHLADVELQAAKTGVGVWKHTDWKKLPEERRAQRDEDREIELAKDDNKLPAGTKFHINKAALDELIKIPGIGPKTANLIIESRPYRKPEDLLEVNGIGPKTLKEIKPFLTFPPVLKR